MLAWPHAGTLESDRDAWMVYEAQFVCRAGERGIAVQATQPGDAVAPRLGEGVAARVFFGPRTARFQSRVLAVEPGSRMAALLEVPHGITWGDRLHDPRVPVHVRLPQVWIPGAGHLLDAALCRDLSMGGMRVELPVSVAVGTPVRAELPLPGGPIVIAAMVRWSLELADGRAECGLRFLGIRRAAEERLQRFLDERMRGEAVADSAQPPGAAGGSASQAVIPP